MVFRGGFRGPDAVEKAFSKSDGARSGSSSFKAKSAAKFKQHVKRTKSPNVARDVKRGGWRM